MATWLYDVMDVAPNCHPNRRRPGGRPGRWTRRSSPPVAMEGHVEQLQGLVEAAFALIREVQGHLAFVDGHLEVVNAHVADLAQQVGFPVDQLKYVLCLFAAYPLAWIHRYAALRPNGSAKGTHVHRPSVLRRRAAVVHLGRCPMLRLSSISTAWSSASALASSASARA